MSVEMHVVEDNVVCGCICVSEVAAYLVHLHEAREREYQLCTIIEVASRHVTFNGDFKQAEGNYITLLQPSETYCISI